MDVCFFGGYEENYPRNAVIRSGLEANGVRVSQCRVNPGGRFLIRYPLLFSRWVSFARGPSSPHSFVLVPEFCHKDVPLARFLTLVSSKRLIFDPLASRFETKILDWRRKPEGSLTAWWNRVIDLWALGLSDLVLADTQKHKDYYGSQFGLDARKIEVLPVGFDDHIFSQGLTHSLPLSKKRDLPFTVLFFGSFLPLHGVDVIIRAAQQVWLEDKTVRFLFIGSGQTFPLANRLASGLNLQNVCFENWISQASLAKKIALEADICLGIFSRAEKAERVVPHKIFQSMALRKPVITSRTSAVEEFFSHRKNIFLCQKAEPVSLALAIMELKKNESLKEEIAAKGSELVWEKFRPSSLGNSLKEILERHFCGG